MSSGDFDVWRNFSLDDLHFGDLKRLQIDVNLNSSSLVNEKLLESFSMQHISPTTVDFMKIRALNLRFSYSRRTRERLSKLETSIERNVEKSTIGERTYYDILHNT